jgi:hypothetical protein
MCLSEIWRFWKNIVSWLGTHRVENKLTKRRKKAFQKGRSWQETFVLFQVPVINLPIPCVETLQRS